MKVIPQVQYWSFLYTTQGALFKKSMLLDRNFLNSAPGLYKDNSDTYLLHVRVCYLLCSIHNTQGDLTH